MPLVICQYWTEHERGWGSRPDGFSLHLSMADRDAFVKEYWLDQPDQVPDEYSAPSGDPIPVDVPASVAKKISGNGRSFFGTLENLIKDAE